MSENKITPTEVSFTAESSFCQVKLRSDGGDITLTIEGRNSYFNTSEQILLSSAIASNVLKGEFSGVVVPDVSEAMMSRISELEAIVYDDERYCRLQTSIRNLEAELWKARGDLAANSQQETGKPMTTKPTCETCQAWMVLDPEDEPDGICYFNPTEVSKFHDDHCMQHIPIEVKAEPRKKDNHPDVRITTLIDALNGLAERVDDRLVAHEIVDIVAGIEFNFSLPHRIPIEEDFLSEVKPGDVLEIRPYPDPEECRHDWIWNRVPHTDFPNSADASKSTYTCSKCGILRPPAVAEPTQAEVKLRLAEERIKELVEINRSMSRRVRTAEHSENAANHYHDMLWIAIKAMKHADQMIMFHPRVSRVLTVALEQIQSPMPLKQDGSTEPTATQSESSDQAQSPTSHSEDEPQH